MEEVVDGNGWLIFDEGMPASREKVLIWNEDKQCVQLAMFLIYSHARYEFIDSISSEILSMNDIRYWQPIPPAPIYLEQEYNA